MRIYGEDLAGQLQPILEKIDKAKSLSFVTLNNRKLSDLARWNLYIQGSKKAIYICSLT